MPMQPSLYWGKRFDAMLKMIDSLACIDFRQLMDVYAEGNLINGKACYPEQSENLQIIYAEQDFYFYLQEFFAEPTAQYAVWVHEEHYVAALRIERYNDGLILTALETAPEARRKGFASKLIFSVVDYLHFEGSGKLYSHVSKHNVASLAVHLSCGFHVVSDNAVYLDGTVKEDSITLCINY